MDDRRWPTYLPRGLTLTEAIPHPSGSMRVRDEGGNEYIDAICGIGYLPLGHGHPRWVEAVHRQMHRLVAASGPFWTEPQQALIAELRRRVPVKDGRVFFGNTGTEVTEAALKLALRSTGRDVVVAFERAFHGRTLGSVALTANADYRAPYVQCLDDEQARFGRMNVARAPFGSLEAVDELFQRYPERVAMVVLEPIQGEGGIYPATREFLVGLLELCHRHGALLGLDEIQAGSGRTGKFTAWSAIVGDDSIGPDVMWIAKGLGGGFPIGACIARAPLAEAMTKGSHGSTFGGNPLACAAALATLQIIDDEDLLASAGAQLDTMIRIARSAPIEAVREIRGMGAMLGIELGDADLAAQTVVDLQARGVLTLQSGGTGIRMLLPYRAGEVELSEVWTTLRACLHARA